MKLTDTHLVLLSAAAQHQDHLLPRPDHISDKAAQTLATKLIQAGLVQEVTVRSGQPHWRVQDDASLGLQITSEGLAALGLDEPSEISAPAPDQETEGQPTCAPREGSKQAAVLHLLRREQGATLEDLIGATGWLAHTTRAALTRLRQRGYELTRSKAEDGRTVYRVQPPSEAPVRVGGEG
jgi:hypothetical protein